MVPVGVRHVQAPVADVQALAVHRVGRPLNLLDGALCVLVPMVLGLWWDAPLMFVLGVWVILVSDGPWLEVATLSGTVERADACFSHQLDAEMHMTAVADIAEQAR